MNRSESLLHEAKTKINVLAGTIDYKTRVVTFTMPSGEKQKVKVDQSVLGLEKFKTGDDVMVEFVDDTIIGFMAPWFVCSSTMITVYHAFIIC